MVAGWPSVPRAPAAANAANPEAGAVHCPARCAGLKPPTCGLPTALPTRSHSPQPTRLPRVFSCPRGGALAGPVRPWRPVRAAFRPTMPFLALGLCPALVRAAAERGIRQPTPVQQASIVPALRGQDLLARAPTGAGKTAAYALPLLQQLERLPPQRLAPGQPRRSHALVLVPTRELALQVSLDIRALSQHLAQAPRVSTLYGGVSVNPQMMALRGGAEVVVATPGRLLDIVGRHALKLDRLALLVLDEVQTGIGRTGAFYAHQHDGITPDVITLAKGLGGGLPIGACIAIGSAADLLQPGMHGSTFGGNPVCTAAGLAVVKTLADDDLVHRADVAGKTLAHGIEGLGHPLVDHVRGRGLLLGVVLTAPQAKAVETAARDAGFLVNAAAPDVVRLAPPLVITDAQIDALLTASR